jgi:RHS repeat-associated protein
VVVQFSQSEIASAVGNSQLLSASLDFYLDPNNGLVTEKSMGDITDRVTSYDDFGAVQSYTVAFRMTTLLQAVDFTPRDALGRITTKTETMLDQTEHVGYVYDPRGRLTDVYKEGVLVSHYQYDDNGNRLSFTNSGGTLTGTYDDQDRLLSYGPTSGRLEFTYTRNGELLTKTDTSTQPPSVTQYEYDALGNLVAVDLPGRQVEYVIDGANRRVGKKVDGVLVQGFLYSGPLEVVAELDGNSPVVSRFVPGGMIKGGVTYRIIRDHLGSPRLVVDVNTGVIRQRMDYDEFGNVIAEWEYDPNEVLLCGPTDCGSGDQQFQPFGFAGGLYDRDTGLMRFGARDYDPEVGRWLSKDPILFDGGDTNLYGYVLQDPVNLVDPFGLFIPGFDNALLGAWGNLLDQAGCGGIDWGGIAGDIPFDFALGEGFGILGGWLGEGLGLGGIGEGGGGSGLVPGEEGGGELPSSGQQPAPPEGQAPVPPAFPGWDPNKAPDGYEWRGPGVPGGEGNYYNPTTGGTLNPDLNSEFHGPHWDWKHRGPGGKPGFRIYPDGRVEPKHP